MAKNILAFFGMVFLTLLIVVGVGLMGYLYDALGLFALPKDFSLAALYQPGEVTIVAADIPGAERGVWSNPLQDSYSELQLPVVSTTPVPPATPLPVPTATPIPALPPHVYQAEINIRLKAFVRSIEHWLDLNDQLVLDNSLINDSAWRNGMNLALANVASSGRALAEVGPAPVDYEAVDQLLDRAANEAQGLQHNYLQAVNQGQTEQFAASGENFSRIKAYLTQTVEAMLALGWTVE